MFILKSFATICDNCGSPLLGNGCKSAPLGPPLELTGIIAPGTRLIEPGFKTPESTAVYTPAMVNEAFLRVNSKTLFNVFISGKAV